MQPLEHRHAAFNQAAVILGEVPDGGFVSPDQLAGVDEGSVVTTGLPQFSLRRGRRIRQQSIQQRRLPCPVAAHERDFFAADDAGGKLADDFLLAVRLTQMFDLQDVLARRPFLLEFDEWALDV